jgi:HEAT repeat protein
MRCRTLVLAACLLGIAGAWAVADTKPSKPAAPTPPSQIGGRTLQQWIHDIKRDDPSVRQTAIKVVPGFGLPAVKEVVPVLLDILRYDRDGSCRVNAALAVYNMAEHVPDGEMTSNAVRVLSERVDQDPQAIVRLHAVVALGAFGNKAAVGIPSLAKSIHDPSSWELRRAAVAALASAATDKKFGPNPQAVTAISNLLLSTDNPERSGLVRMEAVMALGDMGKPAGDKEYSLAVQALQKSLRDPDRSVIIWATAALMHIDKVTDDRLSEVARYLKGKDAIVKFQAARALAALGHEAASRVGDVVALLDDPDPLAVAAGIETLLALGPKSKDAVPALEKVANNREQVAYVRRLARNAVNKLTGAKPTENANDEASTKPSTTMTPPTEIGGKALKQWIEDIKSPDPSVRETAIRAVPHFGKAARAAGPALIQVLKKNDKDAACRVHAAIALSALASAGCVEDVADAVKALGDHVDQDPQSVVRYHCVLALGSFGHAAAPSIPSLVNRIRDPQSWEVRQAVVATLGTVATPDDKIGPPDGRAVTAIANLLLNSEYPEKSGQVRMSAVMALGAMGRPVNLAEQRLTTQALRVTTNDHDRAVQIWARVALMAVTGVTKEGLDEVSKFLKGKDDLAKYNALLAFGAMGKEAKSQIKDIIAALNDRDPMVVGTAIEVLGGFGALAEEAVAPLQKLIDKKDTPDDIKEAAKTAIGQIKSAQKPNR